uniref:Ig-like domain-containing protein n=1 Tax=Esox lucius TaxID=8010 RepID=A0A6Q2YJ43_ESOLU
MCLVVCVLLTANKIMDYREGDTTMVLRTTGSVLVVFLWSLTVVLGQSVKYTSQKICALKGSTVDMSCSYTNPRGYTITATEWFYRENGIWTKIPDNSAGRVSYRGNKDNDCTLRITDLREEDSTSYYFRFTTLYSWKSGSQIVLSVTDLQVNVGWYSEMTLTCSSSCSLPYQTTFIWYKNGQHVRGDSSSLNVQDFSDRNSYSCGVKGHENLLAPAVCKGSYCVKYTSQSICVLKGSTVDLSCSYTYHSYHDVRTTEWYYQKNGNWKEIVDYSTGRVLYLGKKDKDCTLRITDLRETDS